MLKQGLAWLPVLLLLGGTAFVFLLQHPPRTYDPNWRTPQALGSVQTADLYAVARTPAYSLLWVNDGTHQLVWSRLNGRRVRSEVVDTGEISQPVLLRNRHSLIAAWVRDYNGGMSLIAATLTPGHRPKLVKVVTGPQPLEHPYLFIGPRGRIDLVFSWQRYDNFDIYLTSLRGGSLQHSALLRLTHAPIYAFDPRAATTADGDIQLLYLDMCCGGRVWNVMQNVYNPSGRRVGRSRLLVAVPQAGSGSNTPDQWGIDLQRGAGGRLWGAFTTATGIDAYVTGGNGRLLIRPHMVVATEEQPEAVSLAVERRRVWLTWEQSYSLGTYAAVRPLDLSTRPSGRVNRITYEAASQTNPIIFAGKKGLTALWESTAGENSWIEIDHSRRPVAATVADELGINLANPWAAALLLIVASLGAALFATGANLLLVAALVAAALIVLRVLSEFRYRWLFLCIVLTGALFATFVAPGAPMLLLLPLPRLGFAIVPIGLLSIGVVFACLIWTSTVLLRHIEDAFRAGFIVLLGVYVFAFLEATVVVQQQLGFS